VGWSLPLSPQMVGTDISQLTMQALPAGEGVAGEDQKTASCGEVEDLVFGKNSFFWEISCLGGNSVPLCPGWVTGRLCWSYGPELNTCPAIPFSVNLRDTATPWCSTTRPLFNWLCVLPTRHRNNYTWLYTKSNGAIYRRQGSEAKAGGISILEKKHRNPIIAVASPEGYRRPRKLLVHSHFPCEE